LAGCGELLKIRGSGFALVEVACRQQQCNEEDKANEKTPKKLEAARTGGFIFYHRKVPF
jgi:hypothetical protein